MIMLLLPDVADIMHMYSQISNELHHNLYMNSNQAS